MNKGRSLTSKLKINLLSGELMLTLFKNLNDVT